MQRHDYASHLTPYELQEVVQFNSLSDRRHPPFRSVSFIGEWCRCSMPAPSRQKQRLTIEHVTLPIFFLNFFFSDDVDVDVSRVR